MPELAGLLAAGYTVTFEAAETPGLCYVLLRRPGREAVCCVADTPGAALAAAAARLKAGA